MYPGAAIADDGLLYILPLNGWDRRYAQKYSIKLCLQLGIELNYDHTLVGLVLKMF